MRRTAGAPPGGIRCAGRRRLVPSFAGGRATVHDIGGGLGGGFDPDPRRASVLEAQAYVDPAVYAREQELIFARSWQLVCHAEAVRDARRPAGATRESTACTTSTA